MIESLSDSSRDGGPGDLDIMADGLIRAIRGHLLPRLESSGGPVRVVFAGPTGSGKSTLLNSVVGAEVSQPGSIRPTTTLPLVYTAERFAGPFADDVVGYEVVTGSAPILGDMCLIDTPDIDSANTANHLLAEAVLDSADVMVFVVSALRYGDLVPWRLLRQSQARGMAVIHVLNRISPGSAGVVTDFRRLLRREGMSGPVIRVEEHRLVSDRHLPDASIRNLRRQLLASAAERVDESGHLLKASVADVAVRSAEFFDAVQHRMDVEFAIAAEFERQMLDFDDVDLSDAVAHWSRALRTGRHRGRVTSRWLRRNGLPREAIERIGRQISAELMRIFEQRLRLMDLEGGRPVIDLRPGTERDDLYDLIEARVNEWYEGLGSESRLGPAVAAYKRAEEALAGISAMGRPRSGSAGSAEAPADVMAGLASEILTRIGGGAATTLDELAVGRSAVERLSGAQALTDA